MPKSRNSKTAVSRRRDEANARQAKYDALSLDQKIDRAQGRAGESSRELVRLYKQKLTN